MERITFDELNRPGVQGIVKVVRVGTEWRLGLVGDFEPARHIDLITEEEISQVTGAAELFVFEEYWRFNSKSSDTIKAKGGKGFLDKTACQELISQIKKPQRS